MTFPLDQWLLNQVHIDGRAYSNGAIESGHMFLVIGAWRGVQVRCSMIKELVR